MDKKIPLRTCVVTREKFPKWELLRIVRTPEKTIIIDTDKQKTNGRGAYIKKDLAVLEKARKTKVLERHLEMELSDEVYELIEQAINI